MSARRQARQSLRVVLTTCPSLAVARRIATVLVRQRLAACVNVVPRIESVFRWQGKVDRCREVLLVMKTTAAALPVLQRMVVAHHPYEVPEIIALPLLAGHAPYLAWVQSSVTIEPRSSRVGSRA